MVKKRKRRSYRQAYKEIDLIQERIDDICAAIRNRDFDEMATKCDALIDSAENIRKNLNPA